MTPTLSPGDTGLGAALGVLPAAAPPPAQHCRPQQAEPLLRRSSVSRSSAAPRALAGESARQTGGGGEAMVAAGVGAWGGAQEAGVRGRNTGRGLGLVDTPVRASGRGIGHTACGSRGPLRSAGALAGSERPQSPGRESGTCHLPHFSARHLLCGLLQIT